MSWEYFDAAHNDDIAERNHREDTARAAEQIARGEREPFIIPTFVRLGACECGVCDDCAPFEWERNPCGAEPISAISDSRDAAW